MSATTLGFLRAALVLLLGLLPHSGVNVADAQALVQNGSTTRQYRGHAEIIQITALYNLARSDHPSGHAYVMLPPLRLVVRASGQLFGGRTVYAPLRFAVYGSYALQEQWSRNTSEVDWGEPTLDLTSATKDIMVLPPGDAKPCCDI